MRVGDNMVYSEELCKALPDANHLIELSCFGVPVARLFSIEPMGYYCLKSYAGSAKVNMIFNEICIEGDYDIILMNKSFEVGSMSDLDELDMVVYKREDAI